MPNKRQFSSTDFLAWLQDYVSTDGTVHESGCGGERGKLVPLARWRENRFYFFDPDAVAGLCHAVEVFALEEANGRVISLLGDFADFDSHRECYLQLAATIEHVEVLGFGRAPRNSNHLTFRRDGRARHYRGVIYLGARHQALVLCHTRRGSRWTEFQGFYSLNGALGRRFAEELRPDRRLTPAASEEIREFARLSALDQAGKQLERDLTDQRAALDTAMRRLQLDERYGAGQFASELEKGLSRLSQWKDRMPEILSRAGR